MSGLNDESEGSDQVYEDDSRKVFVSRLPPSWTEEHLKSHFEACFGTVDCASIKWDDDNNCSLGFGFVTFESEQLKEKAVLQGCIHAKRRTIHIRPVERTDGSQGRGRDCGICYMWQKSACVRGNTCKFLHEGPGACITQSAPGEGKRNKCLSYKTKGKCSKGNSCPFLHMRNPLAESSNLSVQTENKICHSFKKKGKCRYGEDCMFSHCVDATKKKKPENCVGKKRRIDGDVLVRRKKSLVGPSANSLVSEISS
mmetsp:Transcript_16399/g.24715  ORF Transcript_16399/g.24715 Transcript_16399/m.24715 type:complete len:255 (+) Transcript_16399:44-808(+)